jgi:hypothetical protein
MLQRERQHRLAEHQRLRQRGVAAVGDHAARRRHVGQERVLVERADLDGPRRRSRAPASAVHPEARRHRLERAEERRVRRRRLVDHEMVALGRARIEHGGAQDRTDQRGAVGVSGVRRRREERADDVMGAAGRLRLDDRARRGEIERQALDHCSRMPKTVDDVMMIDRDDRPIAEQPDRMRERIEVGEHDVRVEMNGHVERASEVPAQRRGRTHQVLGQAERSAQPAAPVTQAEAVNAQQVLEMLREDVVRLSRCGEQQLVPPRLEMARDRPRAHRVAEPLPGHPVQDPHRSPSLSRRVNRGRAASFPTSASGGRKTTLATTTSARACHPR